MTNKNTRWLYLASATVMMLFAGIIYAWSILKTPYLSEFGWSQGALGLNFTITMSCFCLGGIMGGILIKKLPLWLIIDISAVLVCLGFFLSAALQGNSVVLLYACYGALAGFGIGMVYNVVVSAVMGWFPDKRATVSGILMMGFGASSLVLGACVSVLMDTMGWRGTYRLMGLCILVIFVAGSALLRMPAPNAAGANDQSKKPGGTQKTDYTAPEMIRRSSFRRFYVFTVLIVGIGACVIGFAKDIAISVGAGESLAVMLTGVLSVCNGLGRIMTGALFDKLGRVKTMRIVCAVAVAATLLLVLAGLTSQLTVLTLAIIVTGLSYGCMPPLTAGFIGSCYGSKNFPLNFSIANTMLPFAAFSATIGGWLYGYSGGYGAVFLMLCVFALTGSAVGLSIKKV